MEQTTKLDETSQHIQQDEDCQPKDLSLKTIKKMKPTFPPPLNLAMHSSPLKEFAIIATSPKSPLMQKNLPFRKRTYSFTGNQDTGQHFVAKSSSGTAVIVEESEQKCPLPSLNEESCDSQHTLPALTKNSPLLDSRLCYPGSPCWSPTLTTCSFLGPASPSHWITGTSVMLSPSPSSLGSSREELNAVVPTNHHTPWPSPVWHCFQPGVLLKLDLPQGGTSGGWKLAEDLCKSFPGWLGPLQVEEVTEMDGGCTIHFKCQEQWQGEIIAQCHLHHTFYIRDKGWSSVFPDQVLKLYGVLCQHLEKNDICVPPTRLPVPSPDICDRFKRFSFPPEDVMTPPPTASPSHLSSVTSSSEFFLSPPTSPNKKLKDSERAKRPMNAFMLFAKRYRLELIQLHPGKDNRAISVILGEAWRNLAPAQKEGYIREAKAMAQERKRLHPDCWKRKRSHSASLVDNSPT
ncbi:hypothetical protein L9F63_016207 [Diploptera punctata]|uniref:HMG box-containing protein 1 n=1 Tax=Diploptera punctata TaxID=6984 RepID=A0AAD8A1K5_DIPPU|nr:hypothetical protein L9F63_016207 [Diploptera punctata]